MTIFKSKTLEGYVGKNLLLIGGLLLVLLHQVLQSRDWNSWNIVLALTLAAICYFVFAWRFSRRVANSLDRAMLHIEAVKMEDYNQYARCDFSDGLTHDLHASLKSLSEHLQQQKSRYDQHAFLLYQLIDQLNTPMMVFNNKKKLTYANAAFSLLYDEPWQVYRLASPKLLGLEQTKDGWHLRHQSQAWQISQSQFIDSGEAHLLLVFTNIDSAVRASQLHAWQQIIRVMGHEIRNSLTPVSSLAESLSTKMLSDREQQALSLISERCHHLQDFISRYSSLSQKLNLNKQRLSVDMLTEKLKVLLPHVRFDMRLDIPSLWADKTFFEQVLINLCKNAVEADANLIRLEFIRVKNKHLINIIDDGHGFANLDNVFVPLFTTKPQGQGIGLTFCRNIIEQHQGSVEIYNNPTSVNDGRGVNVSIRLPVPPEND